MTERFYSGTRDGQLTVRDGTGTTRRVLPIRFDLRQHQTEVISRIHDGADPALIALTLLADALGDDARALKAYEYFSRRVVDIFPDRWTMTRSRILAHVDLIEHEKRAIAEAGNSASS